MFTDLKLLSLINLSVIDISSKATVEQNNTTKSQTLVAMLPCHSSLKQHLFLGPWKGCEVLW